MNASLIWLGAIIVAGVFAIQAFHDYTQMELKKAEIASNCTQGNK